MMFGRTAIVKPASAVTSTSEARAAPPLRPISILSLSAWCGLVAGVLEVGTIILRKQTFDPNKLYGMGRHFLWVIPLSNLCVFLGLGIILGLVATIWPRRGSWIATRLFCGFLLLPSLLIAIPQIYSMAWLVIMLGVAANIVPPLERRTAAIRRLVRFSFPVAALLAVSPAAYLWGSDRIKARHERAQPLPEGSRQNVIFIVLDTVAAGHLNLYGYKRPTSTTLAELAGRGIRFDFAQSTSSWTLPSHASMFTGRWPHELSAGWRTPLDQAYPTVAEILASQGYATAGFAANTQYCARDSGLARGFTEYHDFIYPELSGLRMAVLVKRPIDGLRWLDGFLGSQLNLSTSQLYGRFISWLLASDRKEARMVTREFLDWLGRRQPDRPYFAFLNYFDAHWPYRLSGSSIHRFGTGPKNDRQRVLIDDWWSLDKHGVSQQELGFVSDAYDDCIADLDEQLGRLFDELVRRGELDRTWLILVSDHGESFGEHTGVFCHGTSLYQTELHVPLVIIPPGGMTSTQVVADTVSLRDLAATILDLAGLKASTRFPGESLARFWTAGAPPKATRNQSAGPDQALSEVVPNEDMNSEPASHPNRKWPVAALVEKEWSYIRRDGDAREELFRLPDDAYEQRNLAASPSAEPTLKRMRAALGEATAGPLTPERFRP
jgi:arylsulfatase A-like enzyme